MSDDKLDEEIAKRAYKRIDADGNQILGLDLGGRGLTRLRRCGNCVHFDTDDKARTFYKTCRARDEKVLTDRGLSRSSIARQLERMDQIILGGLGVMGLCVAKDQRTDDNATADFTHHKFLCDRWTSRIIFTAKDGPIDPLPEEVWDRLGEPMPGKEDETA